MYAIVYAIFSVVFSMKYGILEFLSFKSIMINILGLMKFLLFFCFELTLAVQISQNK